MQYWIDKYGFWGYMRHFPINPITMVGVVVIIGIIAMFVVAGARKRKAHAYLAAHKGAALMTFRKKNPSDTDYADNIRIHSLNGETAHWFFSAPTIPALYLKPGDNTLTLHSDWACGSKLIKLFESQVVTLSVNVKADCRYLLVYYIPEARYIFEEVRDN